MAHAPGDLHRELRLVLDVGRRPEKPEGAIVGALAREQHDRAPQRRVTLVALAGVAVLTPLLVSPELDDITGGRVFIKPECLQRTGSFKIRGAYNMMSRLSPEQAARGVVA